MALFEVTVVVDADSPADAILGFLYPDGTPTGMDVHGIVVVPYADDE